MRWLSFNHQGKGTGGEEKGGIFGSSGDRKVKKGEDLEPKSVLDQRSPSPPTSTLSSSLGGGSAGSTDTADVAAVSDHPLVHKWPSSTPTTTPAVAGEAGWRKEDWVSEVEMRGLASGVDDWEMMLTESGASPGQEQTFLRWIMGDVEDPSAATKQRHLMLSSQSPLVEFDVGSAGLGFGLVDPGFGFEPIAGFGGIPPVSATASASASASASGINTASLGSFGGLSQISSTKKNQETVQPLAPQHAASPIDKNHIFSPPPTGLASLPLSFPPAMLFQEPAEEKPQPFGSNLLNQFQQTQISPNPAFFASFPSLTPSSELHQTSNPLSSHFKRHPYMPTDLAAGAASELFRRVNHPPFLPPTNQSLKATHLHTVPYHLQHRPAKPKSLAGGDEAAAEALAIQRQQQALIEELFNAAELVQSGNFVDAHGILARLNHQLPSPIGKPLLRSAFYFKEALQLLANSENAPAAATPRHSQTPLATPLDVVLKLSAYKAFSDVSPVLQFTNFTATQALLEELDTAECIHIIDFDIGVGGQWSSFMQGLAQRWSPNVPLLKITAFVSLDAFHPLELHLTQDNLTNFAAELNIPFEINIASVESFDPAEILMLSSGSGEVIAVNLPVGALKVPYFPTLLRLVKQLLPKIVISVDQGCDRSELPFSHYFLYALQSCMILLDSVDAAGTDLDVANKIERFVLQPRIENCVIGHHRAPEKMLHWRTLFASAGFMPVQFSNFTETQAECLLKRVQVRGFHVEKRQASLYLYWQRGELASVSVWRC